MGGGLLSLAVDEAAAKARPRCLGVRRLNTRTCQLLFFFFWLLWLFFIRTRLRLAAVDNA